MASEALGCRIPATGAGRMCPVRGRAVAPPRRHHRRSLTDRERRRWCTGMRGWRRLRTPAESHLTAHLRTSVWGPAEFFGAPPRRLVGEGLLAGVLGAAAITGTTLSGAWTGRSTLVGGEAGLVCALALALSVVGAGRALLGIVALLGMCLALQAPQAAAGAVLAERGRTGAARGGDVDREQPGRGWWTWPLPLRGGSPGRFAAHGAHLARVRAGDPSRRRTHRRLRPPGARGPARNGSRRRDGGSAA